MVSFSSAANAPRRKRGTCGLRSNVGVSFLLFIAFLASLAGLAARRAPSVVAPGPLAVARVAAAMWVEQHEDDPEQTSDGDMSVDSDDDDSADDPVVAPFLLSPSVPQQPPPVPVSSTFDGLGPAQGVERSPPRPPAR